MVAQFVADLHLPIPQIRLEKYRTNPPTDLEMLTNYFWNIALAESLYPTLHGVELALRNTIHTTLSGRYGTEEWWDQPHTLHRKQWTQLDTKRTDYLTKHGVSITLGQLVAELTFGFWTIILSGPHISNIWRWSRFRLVDEAFPYRGALQLSAIYRQFNDIRIFRNKVMHYERIFDRPNLRQDHADIHWAINWISPELHTGIHAVDSFHDIYTNGRSRTYNKLHKIAGGP